jgi:hypothetical protein
MENTLLNKIKRILGYGIIQLELNDEIIQELYTEAEEDFIFYSQISNKGEDKLKLMKAVWVKRYTIALCKELMSEIRGKYRGCKIPGTEIYLDADQLNITAREDKSVLREMLTNY